MRKHMYKYTISFQLQKVSGGWVEQNLNATIWLTSMFTASRQRIVQFITPPICAVFITVIILRIINILVIIRSYCIIMMVIGIGIACATYN